MKKRDKPDNSTEIRCRCAVSHQGSKWHGQGEDAEAGPILSAMLQLARQHSLGKPCSNGSEYEIRMHQHYPSDGVFANVVVRAVYELQTRKQSLNQRLLLVVEERDLHREEDGKHQTCDVVFEHKYWAKGRRRSKGRRLKYGQFGKQLSADQLKETMRLLDDDGWLNPQHRECRREPTKCRMLN